MQKFFHSADGVVVVYDVTNKESFQDVSKWFQKIEVEEGKRGKSIAKILIGHKADRLEERQVSQKEGKVLFFSRVISHFNCSFYFHLQRTMQILYEFRFLRRPPKVIISSTIFEMHV